MRYSERREEDLSRLEVATLVRELRLFTDDVAMVDGFFRTLGWPRGDFAGGFSAMLVRRDGKWLVSQVRCDPHRDDGTFFTARSTPVSSSGWIDLLQGGSLDAFAAPSGTAPADVWSVEDGVLTLAGRGASIRTKQTFRSLEVRGSGRCRKRATPGSSTACST